MKHYRGLLLAPIFVVVIALAGCAPQAPVAAPSPSGSSVAAAPTPTPTPTVVADPSKVRVPFECDALYTAATARPLVGTSLTSSGGKDAPLEDLRDVAQRQAGVLDCVWSGGIGTDVGPSNFLAISIAPDGVAEFTANLASNQPANRHPVVNTAGDRSSYYCKDGGILFEGYSCSGEMLSGSYWVTVAIIHTVPVRATVAAAAMQSALDKTAATLKAAPTVTLPAWPVPAGPATTFCTGGTAKVRAAIGDTTLKPLTPLGGIIYTADRVGGTGGHYADCTWTGKKEGAVDITLLNGGAWAFPALKPVVPVDSTIHGTKFTPKTIAGADAALVACKQTECEAVVAIGRTAVQIYLDGSSNSQAMSWITRLVAAIKTS